MKNLTEQQTALLTEGICPVCFNAVQAIAPLAWSCGKHEYRLQAEDKDLDRYLDKEISLGRLAELWGLEIEEAIDRLKDLGCEIDLGCGSLKELLSDIENA